MTIDTRAALLRLGVRQDPADRLRHALLTVPEHDGLTRAAMALLEQVDERLRIGLAGVSEEQCFQWAILETLVGDTESATRLLKGDGPGDDPRFPSRALSAYPETAMLSRATVGRRQEWARCEPNPGW